MQTASLTAVGLVRNHNEDVIFVTTDPIGPLPNLFIVADGMGGHNAGEVASQKSVEFSCRFIKNAPQATTPDDIQGLLVSAAEKANDDVYKLAQQDSELNGMGTTFSACVVLGDNLVTAHIGDSRIYFITPDDITQITTDHTYVQELVQAGSITAREAKTHPRRNQLTRTLGFEPKVTADGAVHSLKGVHSVLLCSDGLTDMLSNEEILNIINLDISVDKRVQALIDAANNQGGEDNISAIIIDVKGEIH